MTLVQKTNQAKNSTSRRSFLRKGLAVGGAGTIGAGLLASGLPASVFAEESDSSLTKGDVAILQFLAAAEILETDLWQQYNELGGIQDIANTAAFHFAFIEAGGTSLYPSLAQRVSNVEVLRILLSIGPTETAHFQTWHDKAGNFKVLTDPTNKKLVFPDLNASGSQATQTNLIMPEPTIFLDRKFPPVSIIRPTETKGAAMGAVKALTDDGLFIGQPPEFFALLKRLAAAADAAQR